MEGGKQRTSVMATEYASIEAMERAWASVEANKKRKEEARTADDKSHPPSKRQKSTRPMAAGMVEGPTQKNTATTAARANREIRDNHKTASPKVPPENAFKKSHEDKPTPKKSPPPTGRPVEVPKAQSATSRHASTTAAMPEQKSAPSRVPPAGKGKDPGPPTADRTDRAFVKKHLQTRPASHHFTLGYFKEEKDHPRAQQHSDREGALVQQHRELDSSHLTMDAELPSTAVTVRKHLTRRPTITGPGGARQAHFFNIDDVEDLARMVATAISNLHAEPARYGRPKDKAFQREARDLYWKKVQLERQLSILQWLEHAKRQRHSPLFPDLLEVPVTKAFRFGLRSLFPNVERSSTLMSQSEIRRVFKVDTLSGLDDAVTWLCRQIQDLEESPLHYQPKGKVKTSVFLDQTYSLLQQLVESREGVVEAERRTKLAAAVAAAEAAAERQRVEAMDAARRLKEKAVPYGAERSDRISQDGAAKRPRPQTSQPSSKPNEGLMKIIGTPFAMAAAAQTRKTSEERFGKRPPPAWKRGPSTPDRGASVESDCAYTPISPDSPSSEIRSPVSSRWSPLSSPGDEGKESTSSLA